MSHGHQEQPGLLVLRRERIKKKARTGRQTTRTLIFHFEDRSSGGENYLETTPVHGQQKAKQYETQR